MKLINRTHYINQLQGVMNTPDIKIITGIRRSGKSKLLSAFTEYIRQSDNQANIIDIDLTKLRFESLKEYRALNEYVEANY
ncbi:MAG: AAA family ATPase, partial [Muribaculaceae bacterium]|nr:AAA family ATPase [Muribaculaceae bacterium]